MCMPTCLVLTLLTMQPRLVAEESIRASNRIAKGTGSLSAQDAAAMTREWAEAARPIDPNAPKPKPDAGLFMAAGFGLRRIPKKKAATP